MNSRENKLTRKNVDEQIEQCLSLPLDTQGPMMTSLALTVQDLPRIYEEDHRLEHIWIRINTRMSALNAVRIVEAREKLSTVLLVQTSRPWTPRTEKWSWWWLHLLIYLIVLMVLVAILILIAFFIWPIWSHALYGL